MYKVVQVAAFLCGTISFPISLEIPQAFANAISPPPKSPQKSPPFASPAGSRSLRASMFNSKLETANIDLLLNTIYSVVVEPVMNNPLSTPPWGWALQGAMKHGS